MKRWDEGYIDVYRCFQKIGVYPNQWFISWKTLLKWMIWGVFPYFWKHPYIGDYTIQSYISSRIISFLHFKVMVGDSVGVWDGRILLEKRDEISYPVT